MLLNVLLKIALKIIKNHVNTGPGLEINQILTVLPFSLAGRVISTKIPSIKDFTAKQECANMLRKIFSKFITRFFKKSFSMSLTRFLHDF